MAFEERFGIRLQATRSTRPKAWWGREWQDYMESCHMGARIGRGRQYATGGNLRSLAVSPGRAEASVAGSGGNRYVVRAECQTVGGAAKRRLLARLGAPAVLARLLAGDLPERIGTVFKAEGFPLLPSPSFPLKVSCSCPDGAEHCKHVAALLFVLGEAACGNPLLLLRMRGIAEGELFGVEGFQDACAAIAAEVAKSEAEPPAGASAGEAAEPPAFANASGRGPLAATLGPLPLWRGESRFADAIQEYLACAAAENRRRKESFSHG